MSEYKKYFISLPDRSNVRSVYSGIQYEYSGSDDDDTGGYISMEKEAFEKCLEIALRPDYDTTNYSMNHDHMNSISQELRADFIADENRIIPNDRELTYCSCQGMLMVGEAWIPKNLETQQSISPNYQLGNIIKLPSYEKREVLNFVAKTKNSIDQDPDKSELYEIIREKQNDEKSRILELKKIGNGRLVFTMEHQDPLV